LSPEDIVPNIFNREVMQCVAAGFTEAGIGTGLARKGQPSR